MEIPETMAKSSSEWHFRAYVLWSILPPKTTSAGLAWLLGKPEDAIEALARRFKWKSRRDMRKESKEEEKKSKKKALAVPPPRLNKTLIDIDGNIPKVSLIRIIKFVEYQVMEGARSNCPLTMNAWLSTLSGLDAAQRARKTRQIESIKKDTVKIYMPKQDQTPDIDIEDAKIVPPPVEF